MNEERPHNELFYIAEDLKRLASAFYITGNKQVADELSEHAFSIQKAVKQILTDEAMETNERLKDAEISSFNVLNAVMAGIKLGKEEK